jgi:dethiobiotin synthetase
MNGRRPERIVMVVGTGTEIGKTWVSAHVLTELRAAGLTVAARKPAQSFAVDDDPLTLDAAVLGAATGEPVSTVCSPSRAYAVAMAPTMAAAVLGLPSFTVADLVGELSWPDDVVSVGLVETAGGVCSPQADDGDAVAFASLLAPDVIVLVADAGLGTINAVRLSVAALGSAVPTSAIPVVVMLNRFDASDALHVRNRSWLVERDGFVVADSVSGLIDLVSGL